MLSDLLATKTSPPPSRATLVPRPLLLELLDEARPLTLISAPAGFGKTTLLSAWISQSKHHIGWVSLDDSDNNPTQFWVYLISALQRFDDHLGESALSLLRSPQAMPITPVLTSLLNDITESSNQIFIVLDDYHFIDHEPIHEGLTFLIDHLPVNLFPNLRQVEQFGVATRQQLALDSNRNHYGNWNR